LRGNIDEMADFLEAEHDMAFVREVAIILSDFVFLGVETKWV
jgi:hypothetical protein